MLFYFCGHGIAQGADAALLLEDYGADNDNALDGAIDFRRFHLGMNRCAASQQCFFIDACRASSDMLLENRGYAGRPIVQNARAARRGKPTRQAPAFYSSLAGDAAYARPNQPSVFTEALLRSLRGAGSDDAEGDWRVSTTRLLDALDYFMRREFRSGADRVQIPAVGDQSKVELHYLAEPKVPVEVYCEPDRYTAEAVFTCRSHGAEVPGLPEKGAAHWAIELGAGEYEFQASGNGFRTGSTSQYVRPAYRVVRVEV
jgi:hypothetical protein